MKIDYTYNAVVDRVIDGDTIILIIDLGFRTTMKLPIRLYGIDTMELTNTEGSGKMAKEYVESRLPVGKPVILKTYKNEADKYGRWLGEVWINKRVNINRDLVKIGLATPYFGGKKLS